MLLLQSCNLNNSDDITYNIDLTNIQMEEHQGIIGTSIEKIVDISCYKTQSEVDGYITAPLVYMTDEHYYVVRNFPEELSNADEVHNYISKNECFREIEIYNKLNNELSEIIQLRGIDDTKIIYYSLNYNEIKENYYITGYCENKPMLFVFDKNGMLLHSKELFSNLIDNHVVYGDYLYFLDGSNTHGEGSFNLLRESIITGEVEVYETGVECVFQSENQLYYIKSYINEKFDNDRSLFRYSDTEVSGLWVIDLNFDYNIKSAAYDETNNILYFSDLSYIMKYQNNEVYTVISTHNSSADIMQFDNNYITVFVGYNQMSLFKVTDIYTSIEAQQMVLKVCCLDFDEREFTKHYQTVLQQMGANNVPVRFEFTYITSSEDEYINTMSKKLLAGDIDFDIFYIDTSMSQLFDNNYFTNLGDCDVLVEYYDAMIPGLQEICCIDEVISLVPTHLYSDVFIYNNVDYTEYIDLYKDSWEILDAAKLREPNSSQYLIGGQDAVHILMPWFKQLATNYMGSIIDDKKAMRDLQILYEDIYKIDNLVSIYTDDDSYEYNYDIEVIDNSGTEGDKHHTLCPVMLMDEEYKYAIDGCFLAVNPKSQNKDLAIAFMAYLMNAGMNEMLIYDSMYYVHEQNIESRYSEIYTSADILKYQIAKGVRSYEIPDLYNYIVNVQEDLIIGDIDSITAANQTLDFLKMIRDE